MFATGVTMGLAEWIIDDTCLVSITIYNKIGVVNDPLGQPTVPPGNDFRFILEMFRRTDNLCENSDLYRPWLWVGRVDLYIWVLFWNESFISHMILRLIRILG